jgi:hypothetical protein
MEPRNRCQGINSASLFSLAGRYDNPIPTRCLAPIDFLKIPAQVLFSCFASKRIGGYYMGNEYKGERIFLYMQIFLKRSHYILRPKLWKAFQNNLNQNVANIRWYANICKQILAWLWNPHKVVRISLLKEYLEANICQYKKVLHEYSVWSEYSLLQVLFCTKSIICMRICANILKRMMRINETCE